MPRASAPAQPLTLDVTFYRELHRFYREHRGTIRSRYRQLSRVILDYNDPANARPGQFLRQPQFEALEMYVFLKEYLDSRPVAADFYRLVCFASPWCSTDATVQLCRYSLQREIY